MKYEEALEWICGKRSNWNRITDAENPSDPNARAHSIAMTEVADAASTQRAYWVLRAHEEGRIPKDEIE